MTPLNTDPRCAFTSLRSLVALLARYRAAMATRSDTEMTAHIRGLR